MSTTAENKYESIRLDNQLCFPLYACAKEVVRQYRKPLEALHLTYTQYLVMMVLWEHGTLSESELGNKIHLDSGTLAPLLKRLEKQGYITRKRSDENERKLMISLTEQGELLKEKALSVPCSMQNCLEINEDETQRLKAILNKALLKMEKAK